MNLVTPKQRKEWFSRAEDYADTFLHHTKHFLPHVARFCLVATFLEDGIRMWMQWTEQREYIMKSWSVGWLIGTLFVIINLFGQLVPCGMILTRKKTDIACGMLVFIIGFQVSFLFHLSIMKTY
ncbi:unnamed protein product [Rotaria magnacalcarata]|uniref:Surfeit locus protein 4 n=1 Tax=Rotaria magnacalcarata TaxID=392030 RepID=A0A8S2QJG1_9BILA|nr:unnamed protein product [Rotaria magnacalcarata]